MSLKFALVGYGKMGKEIHQIAQDRDHEISFIIDQDNATDIEKLSKENTDVAIEFSNPAVAFTNISTCLKKGIKVLSGTTGWLSRLSEIQQLVDTRQGTFFYASNYSTGVNITFHLNEYLSAIMKGHKAYSVKIDEIHHTEKKDSPSGTAISLAEGIMTKDATKTGWTEEETAADDKIPIHAQPIPHVPGTHIVSYTSDQDIIEIKHTALGRKGFALGALNVAEWLASKQGFLTMQDYLKIAS